MVLGLADEGSEVCVWGGHTSVWGGVMWVWGARPKAEYGGFGWRGGAASDPFSMTRQSQ